MKKEKSKLYVVLKKKDDIYQGMVENSCFLAWSDKDVRIWFKESHAKFNAKEMGDGAFVARLNSKKCPIKIVGWHPHLDKQNFGKRNSSFQAKS